MSYWQTTCVAILLGYWQDYIFVQITGIKLLVQCPIALFMTLFGLPIPQVEILWNFFPSTLFPCSWFYLQTLIDLNFTCLNYCNIVLLFQNKSVLSQLVWWLHLIALFDFIQEFFSSTINFYCKAHNFHSSIIHSLLIILHL